MNELESELKEIWEISLKKHNKGSYQHLHYHAHWEGILKFWKLKQEIEKCKKQLLEIRKRHCKTEDS